MVERQLPKLHTRVRFPSPAPKLREIFEASFEIDFERFVCSLISGATAERAWPDVCLGGERTSLIALHMSAFDG